MSNSSPTVTANAESDEVHFTDDHMVCQLNSALDVSSKAPAQSVHRKFKGSIKLEGKVRRRGRKPEGDCLTGALTEGDVRLRRGIFRKLKTLTIEQYSQLKYLAVNNKDGFNHSFLEIF